MSERALEDPRPLTGAPSMAAVDARELVARLLAECEADGVTVPAKVLAPLAEFPEMQIKAIRAYRQVQRSEWFDTSRIERAPAANVLDRYQMWRKAAASQAPVPGLECQASTCRGRLYAADKEWLPSPPDIRPDGSIVCESRCESCGQPYTNVYDAEAGG